MQTPAERLALRTGRLAENGLAAGESRTYLLTAPPGTYAALAVEQDGLDVVVDLFSADGRRLTRVDSPNGRHGAEPLPLVVEGPGPLRLEIHRAEPTAPPGHFAVIVSELRPATAACRTRTEADRVFAEGEELRRRADPASLHAALERDYRSLSLLRSLAAGEADPDREGDVLYGLGSAHLELGEAEVATRSYLEALALFLQHHERDKTASTLNGLGAAYRALGEPRRAISFYQEALKIFRSGGRPAGEEEAKVQMNLGRAFLALGQVEDALQAFDAALALWRRLDDRFREAQTLRNRAEVLLKLGDSRGAIDSFDQALPLLIAEGKQREAAKVLVGRGVAEARPGQEKHALELLERALAMQKELGDRPGELNTLGNLCVILLRLGDPPPAQSPCARALALAEELGDQAAQGSTLTNLGWLQEQQNQLRQAEALYERAIPLLAAAGDRDTEATALSGVARARRRRGDLEGALQAVRDALQRVESLRTEPGSAELRSTFFASRQDLYRFWIDLLMEMHSRQPHAGYARKALEASEKARARSLLDRLGETGRDWADKINPALLAQEREVGRRLDAAEQRRRWLEENGAPEPRRRAAAAEVRSLLAERERAAAAIAKASPHLPSQGPLGPREIQRQIVDQNTLLLELALGEERSFLWAVAPEGVTVFPLPGRAALEEPARRVHSLLAAGKRSLARSQTGAALADLSRLLLTPVAERLGNRRLLIVADGALFYVPFAALPDPLAPGEPLLVRHEVVTLPSASSLAGLRRATRNREPAPATLAVLADPVFDPADPRVAGARRSGPATSRPGSFTRLPFSRHEAETILSLVPPAERLAALDFAASRDIVMDGALARYRIIHFATHGVLDTEHPALSGIVLSLVDQAGRPRKGFLRVHEIERLHLPADLVVLSACATALGREVRGEGLVGLTQSFFRAGARAVLVSLWPVDDLATADLMQSFYRELLKNRKSPAAALREAQLSLLRRPDRSSPTSWAGFVLLGDWRSP